jgi:hypothetical protein
MCENLCILFSDGREDLVSAPLPLGTQPFDPRAKVTHSLTDSLTSGSDSSRAMT